MHGFRRLGVLLSFQVAAALVLAATACAGQAGTDDASFRMYFKEEELVESATRSAKPISQVAENVTIVTAEEIEAMNAHTLAEVLERVTGVYIDLAGRDFAALAPILRIQASHPRHVLVLVDGVPLNFLSGANAEPISIPVGAIERVEVIKGPASSTWGSALGGVVNVLTKRPGGEVSTRLSASGGERGSYDLRAEASGPSYYLFAQRQHSDGIVSSRAFDQPAFLGKVGHRLGDVKLGGTFAVSRAAFDHGELADGLLTSTDRIRTFLAAVDAEVPLAPTANAYVQLYDFRQRFDQTISQGPAWPPAGERFKDSVFDERTLGASGRLVWSPGSHAVVLGGEYASGRLVQTIQTGPIFGDQRIHEEPGVQRWAVYVNDTVRFGSLTLTPGVRYDRNSRTGGFLSPSLGATQQLARHTVLRASVARGFTAPGLSDTAGGGPFYDPNPDLEPERVWSYQAGLESDALRWVWLKLTAFRHDARRTITTVSPPEGNSFPVNAGRLVRTGFEAEAESAPLAGFSAVVGYSYVHVVPEEEGQFHRDVYQANAVLRYVGSFGLRAELTGHFVYWDLPEQRGDENTSRNDFLWDLHVSQRLGWKSIPETEVFASVRNLFNGRQYGGDIYPNAPRWVEGGVRVRF